MIVHEFSGLDFDTPQYLNIETGYYFKVFQRNYEDLHWLEYRYQDDLPGKWRSAFLGDLIPILRKGSEKFRKGQNWPQKRIAFRCPGDVEVYDTHQACVAVMEKIDGSDDIFTNEFMFSKFYTDHTCPVNTPYSTDKIVGIIPCRGMQSLLVEMDQAETSTYGLTILGRSDNNGEYIYTPILPVIAAHTGGTTTHHVSLPPMIREIVIYASEISNGKTATASFRVTLSKNELKTCLHTSSVDETVPVGGGVLTCQGSVAKGPNQPVQNCKGAIINNGVGNITANAREIRCFGMSNGTPWYAWTNTALPATAAGATRIFTYGTEGSHAHFLSCYAAAGTEPIAVMVTYQNN